MPSDQFDFVRARATGCRPISPGLDLVHCRQLILKLINPIQGGGAQCAPTGFFLAVLKRLAVG